ncbi:MAG: helix-turn-helix domain-containing protein [Desulfovibrio sp.]|jgi:transcriptional regulator with XRE-family HTH domain
MKREGREGRKVRAWMVERGITVSDVARRAGISRPIVSETVHGRRNNRKALRALLDVGCPGRLLALPEDMKGKEAA